jgi:hypothetical protein
MQYRLLSALLLTLTVFPEVMAKQNLDEIEYTYVEASLGFPWFMFFVFTVLVLIPFLLIVFLSWRKRPEDESQDQLDQPNY